MNKYTLPKGYINLTYTGTGNFTGTGNAVSNLITSKNGDDLLDGGRGADTLVGGGGNDTYLIDNVNDVINENVEGGLDSAKTSVTYTLGQNVENLVLMGSLAINGTGNSLDNTITGNSANNILNGGLGVDVLIGGKGNDTYLVNSLEDIVLESTSEGIDLVETSVSYTLQSNVENLRLTSIGTIDGGGNILNNSMIGNDGNNLLHGESGNDTLDGRKGHNILNGGIGNDTYIVNLEGSTESNIIFNQIIDAQGVDRLTLTGTIQETNAINGSWWGIRRLNDGKDVVIGIFDDNLSQPINGVVIEDQFSFVNGNFSNTINSITLKTPFTLNQLTTFNLAVTGTENNLIGSKAADFMMGFGGGQTLRAGAGNDIISASRFDGREDVYGAIVGDTMYGEAGSDDLMGRGGNDTLIGGLGNDFLLGDSGADKFVFSSVLNAKTNVDEITDFETGLDIIELDDAIFKKFSNAVGHEISQSSFVIGNRALDSDDYIVYNNTTGALYYDSDGSGRAVQVQFAVLADQAELVFSDIWII